MSEAEGFTQAIERGETYDHTAYGPVEVLGIWKGMKRVDKAGNGDEDENAPMVVSYAIKDDRRRVGELTATLNEFLNAIESGSDPV